MSASAIEITSNRFNRRPFAASPRSIPAPGIEHQAVVLKLAALLLQYSESRNPGYVLHAPCDVILSKETVVRPDICFVKKSRSGIIFDRFLRGIPDLAIEITPHLQQEHATLPLKRILSRHGVQEFWDINYLKGTAEIWLWSEMGYISAGRYKKSDQLSSSLLPGFSPPLSAVFGEQH